MGASSLRPVHTYSIVARDPSTGQLGVAVQSHAFSVGSIVTWAEAGVGAVATQSLARLDYGPEGLTLMRQGRTAEQALAERLAADPDREVRQVAMVDAAGSVAAHTGARCIQPAGHIVGSGYSVQANLMLNDTIWPAMQQAYESAGGDLVERLLAALDAAQAAGGDIRGQQSAALLVVEGTRAEKPYEGRIFDLRVDDAPRPLQELRRLVRLKRAYMLSDVAEQEMVAGRPDAASAAFQQAVELAPDLLELRFWAAAALFNAGHERQALELFREVFSREPIWADLVPRLIAPGMLPDDPAAIQRILNVNIGSR
jgi:uncharacterized Ntn-hydrolase superfamily protein